MVRQSRPKMSKLIKPMITGSLAIALCKRDPSLFCADTPSRDCKDRVLLSFSSASGLAQMTDRICPPTTNLGCQHLFLDPQMAIHDLPAVSRSFRIRVSNVSHVARCGSRLFIHHPRNDFDLGPKFVFLNANMSQPKPLCDVLAFHRQFHASRF
jgi:hypothetical protein